MKAGSTLSQHGAKRKRGKAIHPDIVDSKLAEQNFRCLCCDVPFGTTLRTPFKHIHTKMEIDYIVPYSATQNASPGNIALACSFCNHQKADKLFASVQKVRDFIADVWKRQQITILGP